MASGISFPISFHALGIGDSKNLAVLRPRFMFYAINACPGHLGMTSGETSVLEIGPPVPTPEALRAASISEKHASGDTKDHSLTGIPAVTSIFPLRSLITQYV